METSWPSPRRCSCRTSGSPSSSVLRFSDSEGPRPARRTFDGRFDHAGDRHAGSVAERSSRGIGRGTLPRADSPPARETRDVKRDAAATGRDAAAGGRDRGPAPGEPAAGPESGPGHDVARPRCGGNAPRAIRCQQAEPLVPAGLQQVGATPDQNAPAEEFSEPAAAEPPAETAATSL